MNIEYMKAQCYGQFGELKIELSCMLMKTIKNTFRVATMSSKQSRTLANRSATAHIKLIDSSIDVTQSIQKYTVYFFCVGLLSSWRSRLTTIIVDSSKLDRSVAVVEDTN